MTVKVDKGYLALRSEKAYDKNNEIGQLNTGDTVELIEKKTVPTGMCLFRNLEKKDM